MKQHMTTTAFELPGYRVTRNLGVVRGVTAGLRSIVGGKIHEYVQMCEEARAEAFELMLQHAEQLGANAVIGIRYDATEISENMTEVLAYGAAVVVEPS